MANLLRRNIIYSANILESINWIISKRIEVWIYVRSSFRSSDSKLSRNQLNQKLKLMVEVPRYVIYSNKNDIKELV